MGGKVAVWVTGVRLWGSRVRLWGEKWDYGALEQALHHWNEIVGC